MKDIKMNRQNTKIFSVLMRTKEKTRRKDFLFVLCAGGKTLRESFLKCFEFTIYRLFKSGRSFSFRGETLHYFYGLYKTAWRNERSIEIPIICSVIKCYEGTDILEVEKS